VLTRETFTRTAQRLYDFCAYPAVRYKVFFHLLDAPYDGEALTALRPAFLGSDIVKELRDAQDYRGGWGRLRDKDYSAKDKFPSSLVAIRRCQYIGLTLNDGDILLLAHDYLEEFLKGTAREPLFEKNERAAPWNAAMVSEAIESIKPYNKLCDRTYNEWMHIATRAYENGEYSYERDRDAQHEVFWTKEARLVPMQFGLLLKRRAELPPGMEDAMLRHHGEHAYQNGYFWNKTPQRLPDHFVYKQTRRWFHTFNYINQFRGSALYLADAAEWLMANRNADGLWDWGTQTKDPWGYFGYFSANRDYKHNRVVDCTMEALDFLKAYMDNNAGLFA